MEIAIRGCAALVLYAADLERTGAFYRALGIELREEKFAGGPAFLSGDIGGVQLVIDPATDAARSGGRWTGGATQISFAVDRVEDAMATALRAGGSQDLRPELTPFGRRGIVLDPDGRPVEFLEPEEG
jgi:predicted enzyme related to lactoylglutathione lyase